jgi:reducing polyketide synthase SwnK
MEKALSLARLQPNDITYVETHGTATKLGDPIEANAIAEVFGRDREGREPLLIGSAKSNLGHTQAAAGLVGLLKVVMSMQHAVLPESIHITTLTAAIDWEASNMTPVMKKQSWDVPGTKLRRAGVSAFGIGGTNAHVVIEQYASEKEDHEHEDVLTHAIPFILSGSTDAAVRAQARKLIDHLTQGPQPSRLKDVSFSQWTGYESQPCSKSTKTGDPVYWARKPMVRNG